jgi:hypothetical protein
MLEQLSRGDDLRFAEAGRDVSRVPHKQRDDTRLVDQVFGELAGGDVVAELQPSSPTTT